VPALSFSCVKSDNYKLSDSLAATPYVAFSDLASIESPAFLYSEEILKENLDTLLSLDPTGRCSFLYPLKSGCLKGVVRVLLPRLAGLAVSSLFEARLARDLISESGSSGMIHLTAPGIRSGEIDELAEICTAISFNSMGQLARFSDFCKEKCSVGLRVNPGVSFANDPRYDTCRPLSRLGVHVDTLGSLRPESQSALPFEGLHFHSNCESRSFSDLLYTVRLLSGKLPHLLEGVSWLNLGGGYLPREARDPEVFSKIIEVLAPYGCLPIFEPGTGLANSAGFILTTVLDIFDSEGQQVAVLDTTTNHIPEVIEYQTRVDIMAESPDGPHLCRLCGCTCSPADVFGDYRFPRQLQIGDRLLIRNVGTYTLVKASTFNGINLPTVYRVDGQGNCSVERKFTYEDFNRRWQTIAEVAKEEAL
jgi:carboxynorspermidine decarboxylase